MAFIKTPAEISRIQNALAHGRFAGFELLSVSFLTTPAVVRRILPPGLEPTDQPVMQIGVSRWHRSSCIRGFDVTGLLVQARHGAVVGEYAAWMPVSTEAALVYGRDLVGEPKKLGEMSLTREGNQMRATCQRHGTPLVTIDATLTGPATLPSLGFNIFNYKYLLKPRCEGLFGPAHLIRLIWEMKPSQVEVGTATLTLGSTPHDPLQEIEIVQNLGATYVRVDEEFTGTYEVLAEIEGEKFLPHAISRMDDWSLLDNMG